MWRAYTGLIHCVFDQIPIPTKLLYHLQTKPERGGVLRHLPPSPCTVNFFRKSRHLGFGDFINIWSMMQGQRDFSRFSLLTTKNIETCTVLFLALIPFI